MPSRHQGQATSDQTSMRTGGAVLILQVQRPPDKGLWAGASPQWGVLWGVEARGGPAMPYLSWPQGCVVHERIWLASSPWVWLFLAIITIPLAIAGRAMWIEQPATLWWMVIPGLAVFALVFGNLHIVAEADGLLIRYFPLWHRRIPWSDVEDAQAERYRPWRFGGWGIRYSRHAIAFSVITKQAIRLTVRGRRLQVVFSTKQPDDWIEALKQRYVAQKTRIARPANRASGS